MKLSRTVFHCITFITLVVVFIFLWNNTQETSSAEHELTLDQVASNPIYQLQEDLYSMLPVLIGSILISVVLAIYLTEWWEEASWIYRIFDFIISVLAGIPSIFYGLLCIYFFVFKNSGVSYLTESLTIILLVMPITIRSTQNAVKGVDVSIREAVYALGVNKWRVIIEHVLSHAYSNIMSGICTAVSRAFGVAALIISVFAWTRHTIQSESESVFYIPKNIFFLLIAAVLCSVFSSLLKKQSETVN